MNLMRYRRARFGGGRLVVAMATLAATLLAGCADMPMNKPSALSPAHQGTVQPP